MKVLKFRLSGATAFFKKPDVNTYFYFTYGHVHKVALLGLFGAILGYKGYAQMQKDDIFPEFYARLKDLALSIVPNQDKGMISKKMQVFNNSVGYASQEQGGNLIVKEQWLENPSWDIYVQVDCPEGTSLMNQLVQGKTVFTPYLGKNDHFATISHIEVFEQVTEESNANHLNCLFPKQRFELLPMDEEDEDEEDNWSVSYFKYEERLPLTLDEQTNLYHTEPFVFTNIKIGQSKGGIYQIGQRMLTFY